MIETSVKDLILATIPNGLDYATYRANINFLLKSNKTTGDNQSDSYINYTKLNVQRMKRLDKKLVLSDELKSQILSLKKNYTFLVVAEAWCGDAAQSLPIFAKMAELTDKIDLKIVLRDENIALIEAFQTNGANSIPKLIAMEADCEVMGTWGPKPEKAMKMLAQFKDDPQGKTKDEFSAETQLWYSKDKGKSIMNELSSLILHWENKKVVVPCSESV